MIDFALTEEEELTRKTAHDFALRRLKRSARAHETGVPDDVLGEARELGLEDADSVSPLARVLVLEELATQDAAVAVELAGDCVLDLDAELRVEGDRAMSTRGTGSAHAGQVVDRVYGDVPLCARTRRTVIVRPDRTLELEGGGVPVRALAACTWSLRLDGEPARTGEGDTAPLVARVRARRAAVLVGLARAAWEYAAAYAKQRVTFGKPLALHQAVAFMLADMAIAVDAARLATHRAALDGRHAEDAYAEAAEAALAVTERAVQLLGGHGYLKDHPVEKWMREARALTLVWGP